MTRVPVSATLRASLIFVTIALVCLGFADLEIVTLTPWQELSRLLLGLATPSFSNLPELVFALLRTVAFALLGVSIASICGFALATIFHLPVVQWLCALLRSVHELFWALLLLQMLGFHPLSGILAIAVPYTGIFARVYAEIMEENSHPAFRLLNQERQYLARFLFTQVASAWPHLRSYTLYRFECGMRSVTVIGFLGIPTLGFYLESAFMQGHYSEVATILLMFFLSIATLKFWLRPGLLPIYLVAAPFLLDGWDRLSGASLVRFLSVDIVPAPLRNGEGGEQLLRWFVDLITTQVFPGLLNTFVLTQIVLVTTAMLALLLFPLVSEKFSTRLLRRVGHVLLVTLRSTPEYILAFVFLLLWGPSLLPAIVALTMHNGAIVGYLVGQVSNYLVLRPDHSRGINLYGFEVVPRLFGQLLALLFYRWEIIFRESAILGILGIQTLGFFIEGAMEELRFDRAVMLILVTALINILLDQLARRIRQTLKLKTSVGTS